MTKREPDLSVYTVGGTVQAGPGRYLRRRADDELLALCRDHQFAFILTTRQVGKSSLVAGTAEALAGEGFESVVIDLNSLGTVGVTAESWYLGLVITIESRLGLKTDAAQWWAEHQHLTLIKRLTDFLEKVVVAEVDSPVVIFIDEIDTTLKLPFTDDLFAAIRYIYNARPSVPALRRLSFVLIGVATPDELIEDRERTPFNLGVAVGLSDFTPEEAWPLVEPLGLDPQESRRVLSRVLYWTKGHPYLTQRLLHALAAEGRDGWTKEEIDRVVAVTFFGEQSTRDYNLSFVRDMLSQPDPPAPRAGGPDAPRRHRRVDLAEVLLTYRSVRRRRAVRDEARSLVKTHLKLAGVVRSEGGLLRLRNRIYGQVFDEQWVREHLPPLWIQGQLRRMRRITAGALVALVLFAGLAFAAVTNGLEARRQTAEADRQRVLAVSRLKEVEYERGVAEEARQEAAEGERRAQESAQRERAAREEAEALRTRAEGETARANREARAAAANAGRAVAAEKEALKQQRLAEEQKRFAEAERQESFNGKLGALAELTGTLRPDLLEESLLLAEMATRQPGEPSEIAEKTLLKGLSLLPPLVAEQKTSGGSSQDTLLFDAAGRRLLMVNIYGDLQRQHREVWDLKSGTISPLPDTERFLATPFFGPDGALLAWERLDAGILIIQDTASGNVVKELKHGDRVRSVAVSGDGRYLATLAASGVNVWDSHTDSLRAIPTEEAGVPANGEVADIRLGLDGQVIYLIRNNSIVAREVASGRKLFDFKPTESVLDPFAASQYVFSPDRKLLAINKEGKVVVWNALTGERIAEVPRVEEGVRFRVIEFNQQGTLLALTDRDRRNIHLYALSPSLSEVRQIRLQSSLNRMQFSADGKYLLTDADRLAQVWRLDSGAEIYRVTNGNQGTREYALSPDGKIAALGRDGVARVWSISGEDASPVRKVLGHESRESAVSRNGKYVAIIAPGRDAVQIWDANGGRLAAELKVRTELSAVAISPDGDYVAALNEDYTAQVWRTADALPVAEYAATIPLGSIGTLALSKGGEYLAVGQVFSSTTRVWDVFAKRELPPLECGGWPEFSPDGRLLLTLRRDGLARADAGPCLRRMADGQTVRLPNFSLAVGFSSDGRYLAVKMEISEPEVRVIDTEAARFVASYVHPSRDAQAAISPDGERVALSAGGDDVLIWDWRAGTVQSMGQDAARRSLSDLPVVAVAFSQDGRHLVTVTVDDITRVWEWGEGRLVTTFNDPVFNTDPPPAAILGHEEWAVFSEDGRYIITNVDDIERVKLQLWRKDEILRQTEARLTLRSLSPEQWRRYVTRNEYERYIKPAGGAPAAPPAGP